jgi:membrane protein involved in colicin uptake
MTENTALVVLPEKESAITVFSQENGLEPYLQTIREKIEEFKANPPKLTTESGRKEYRSFAHKLARMKTALEGLKKDCTAEMKLVTSKIDKEGKRSWDLIESWQDEVLEPVIAYEKEQKEIEAKRIADEAEAERVRLAEIAARELQEQVDRDHELAFFMYADHLREKEEAAKQAIIDAEIAAKAQKDREEQIAKDAAEKARKDAELAAEAERKRIQDEADRKAREQQLEIERAQREKAEQEAAALRKEQEHAQALAKAEQDRLAAIVKAESEKQAAIDAERKRQADQAAREKAEAEQREKNKAHAKKINNEALADMVKAGCSEECAKAVIAAIARGQIRNVTISY